MMDPALQQRFDAAIARHQAGDLDTAAAAYRGLLAEAPQMSEMLHGLGLLHHQLGRVAEAERLIARAVGLRPDIAIYQENLAALQKARGAQTIAIATCRAALNHVSSTRLFAILLDALIESGAFAQALAVLDDMARSEPVAGDRLADRAHCLLRLGQAEEALAAAMRAVGFDPTNGNALSVLAEQATLSGDHRRAVASWARALHAHPGWTTARVNLGLSLLQADDAAGALRFLAPVPLSIEDGLAATVLNGRAAAHRQLKQVDLALASLRAALSILPSSGEYLSNLSELLRKDTPEQAVLLAARAVAVEPLYVNALNNLGLALEETDRERDALAHFRRVIALAPSYADAQNNSAGPLRAFGFFKEAGQAYRRMLAITPDVAAGVYGLGTTQLVMGNLADGWRNFERRLGEGGAVKARPFGMPFWNGEPLDGRLLVWAEQGLGDEIVFGTMLADLARRNIRAIVECDSRMIDVFARSHPGLEFVARTQPPDPRLSAPDVRAQVAMGSLARWTRRQISDFSGSVASLVPRPDLVQKWRRRLAELPPGPKIGFAWRSQRMDAVARREHPPILDWGPVLAQRRATYVSLQYGETEPDLQRLEAAFGVKVHRLSDLDLWDDLDGILAVSAALDLVLASPTTAFCLPAAAGTPVWLIVPENTYLLLGSDGYPWFPSVRTYVHHMTQPRSTTMGHIARDLSEWLAERSGARK